MHGHTYNLKADVSSLNGKSGTVVIDSPDASINITVDAAGIHITDSGGGGGGTETGQIVTSGSIINILSVTAGQPFNLIIRKSVGSATLVNLPAPNPLAPWGRINIKDGAGDAGTNPITVTPASGNVDAAASFVMMTNFQGQSYLDDGTTWNVQN